MNLSREELKAKLIEKLSKQLDEVLASPTVTMTDIENVVAGFQQAAGQEVAEGLLALKKTAKRD
jgi:hypothetical protein